MQINLDSYVKQCTYLNPCIEYKNLIGQNYFVVFFIKNRHS